MATKKTNAKTQKAKAKAAKKTKSKTSTYTVKKGDTLAKIAKKYKTTTANLKKLNNLKTTKIKTGQKLKVPKAAAKNSKTTKKQTTSNNTTKKPTTTNKTTPAPVKKPYVPKAGKIGTLGDLTFTVSRNTIKTFEDMSWNKTASIATHDRIGRRDLTEFLGMEPDTMDFEITFSVFLGTNPLKQFAVAKKMQENGTAAVLTLGGKVYGSYKWLIQSQAITLKRFDNTGNLLELTTKIKIIEYPKR